MCHIRGSTSTEIRTQNNKLLNICPVVEEELAAGVSHNSPRTPDAHISGLGASNTTKIPREDTQRDTKRAKWWRKNKKREILGSPPFGAPPFGAQFLWVWGLHPSGPRRVFVLPCIFSSCFSVSFFFLKKKTETPILAEVGQAHNWPKSVKELAKVGLAKVGHDLCVGVGVCCVGVCLVGVCVWCRCVCGCRCVCVCRCVGVCGTHPHPPTPHPPPHPHTHPPTPTPTHTHPPTTHTPTNINFSVVLSIFS